MLIIIGREMQRYFGYVLKFRVKGLDFWSEECNKITNSMY